MTDPTSLMRYRHCPHCGFDTQQYVQDYTPDGLPTGWVCLVDTSHILPT